ncbi:hypothetical protein ABBQ38_004845 [Trebouxia sp. C0009 RCD-2024]
MVSATCAGIVTDTMEPEAEASGGSGHLSRLSHLQMQQGLAAKLRARQYTEALTLADAVLRITPQNPLVRELRKMLAEKVALDASNGEETGSDKEGSDSASSLEEESEDEEQDSSKSISSSGSDSGGSIAAETVCEVLHISSGKHVLSSLQRKQLSSALQKQLADLKIQEASEHLHGCGLK